MDSRGGWRKLAAGRTQSTEGWRIGMRIQAIIYQLRLILYIIITTPVDQLVETDGRMEEKHSQMANFHRAGNNNGDGDTVGNRTSGQVKQRGSDKSSTSDAQQPDRKQNQRDGISEGDGTITSGNRVQQQKMM